jgi:hypothetical protein
MALVSFWSTACRCRWLRKGAAMAVEAMPCSGPVPKINVSLRKRDELLSAVLQSVSEAEATADTFLDLAAGGEGGPQWPFAVAGMVRRIRDSVEALEEEVRRGT